MAGKEAKCPACGEPIQIPASDEEAKEPAADEAPEQTEAAAPEPEPSEAAEPPPAAEQPEPEAEQPVASPSADGAPSEDGDLGENIFDYEPEEESPPHVDQPEDAAAPSESDQPTEGEAEEGDDEEFAVECPECGAKLSPQILICMECGTNVKTGEKIGTQVIQRPPFFKRNAKTLIIAAVVIVVLGGLGYVAHMQGWLPFGKQKAESSAE